MQRLLSLVAGAVVVASDVVWPQPRSNISGSALRYLQEQDHVRCSDAFLAAARYGDEVQLVASIASETWSCIDPQGRTPLHLAAELNQLNASLSLLAAGALMQRDELGQTPMHSAVINGHQRILELLLQSGAYIELLDNAGRTPLIHAARMGHIDLVRVLLDFGANILAADGDTRTALHYVSRSDVMMNTTRLLVDRGAEMEAEDIIGFRPLHFACHANQVETVNYLMDRGADMYAMDLAGWNPMVHAAAKGWEQLVMSLVVRALQPDPFPPSDPALIALVEQDASSTTFGLPSAMLAFGLSICGGLILICPCFCLLRRCGQARNPYHVGADDHLAEDFLDGVFEHLLVAKGMQEEICAQWETIPATGLSDIHRPRH